MNKHKQYIRRWNCSICGHPIIAHYDFSISRWILKCVCGEDDYYKKLNSSLWGEVDNGDKA